MNYEDAFTDYESRRIDAAWDGFKHKNFLPMFNFIWYKRGFHEASYFLNNLTKKERRAFCCYYVIKYDSSKEHREKALKWYKKKGLEIDDNIIRGDKKN